MCNNRFKEGREGVNDDARPDHPSTSTTDDNIETVTIKEFVDDVSISFGSCQPIFTYILGMNRATFKIVPKLLNFVQSQRRMDITQGMLTAFNGDSDFLITGDKSWVYGYEIETKAQSSPFAMLEEIKENSKQELLAMPNDVPRIEKKRWHKCITSEGHYFEGDKIVIDK